MDYSKFQFPPYVYAEFPKWVQTRKGPVLVQDASEEAEALKEEPKPSRKDK